MLKYWYPVVIAFEHNIDIMKLLELKVPPLFLMALFALLMWISDQFWPLSIIDSNVAVSLMIFFIIFGGGIIFTGAFAFNRAQTTVNPTKPDETSSLVKGGIYKITRNPMYVGMVSCLIGWGCYLSHPISLIFIIGFTFYMNCFQIKPEEKMLTEIFGQEYIYYCTEVRRWI